MKFLSVLFLLAFVSVNSKAQSDSLKKSFPIDFQKGLTEQKMTFKKPDGTIETPVIKNGQMHYEYALKLKGKNLEIRYAIASPPQMPKGITEEDKSKKPGAIPMHQVIFLTVLRNISDLKYDLKEGFKAFHPESVKKEFNADWGGLAIVELGKTFGQDYTHCLAVMLHKENVGDAYYFYLADAKETLLAAFKDIVKNPNVFYALKFE